MRMVTHKHGDGGFTVMELMVVTAIAAVVMGIAIPSFLTWLPTLRLSSAARQVATDLQVARMKAISQNASNTVTFASGTYTFTLSPTDSRNVGQLYPGITVTSPSNPTFSPRGTATAAVTITLSNGSATTLVCVKTVGRVNIQNSASCT